MRQIDPERLIHLARQTWQNIVRRLADHQSTQLVVPVIKGTLARWISQREISGTICRGDDLLSSTPRQVYLQRLLGYPTPEYLHVPLVLGNDGERLSKRNGALSLRDLDEQGRPAESVRELLLASIGGSFSADALLRVGTWTI